MWNRFHKKIYTVIAVVLIILIYIQIFRFSNAPAEVSELQSMSIAERIVTALEALLPGASHLYHWPDSINELDRFLRKAAHFSEYALLGILTYSIAICWNKKDKKGTVYSFLFVVILAALDEFHQYFVPGRSCSLWDICIDSGGCIAGMMILSFLYERYNRKRIREGRIL